MGPISSTGPTPPSSLAGWVLTDMRISSVCGLSVHCFRRFAATATDQLGDFHGQGGDRTDNKTDHPLVDGQRRGVEDALEYTDFSGHNGGAKRVQTHLEELAVV